MKNNEKDIISIVTECTRTGANCDCCGHYEEYTIDLDCGHQVVQSNRCNKLDKIVCPECSGYYDDL